MKNPKKWTEVYPQGTKEGDEEQKFFKSLARNPKFEWRSVGMIIKESGLTRKRIEEIISKYVKQGLIFPSPSKEEHWAYWERVPGMVKDTTKTITDKDQNNRIDKQLDSSACKTTAFDAPNTVSKSSILSSFPPCQIISPFVTLTERDLSYTADAYEIFTNDIPDKIVINTDNIPDRICVDFSDTIKEKWESIYVKM